MTETNNADLTAVIKWDGSGLVPAVVQDAQSKEVLMLAYMNAESLRLSAESGVTWFWSRSRGELWNKGATSGHTQRIVSMAYDCDGDTLLVRVIQQGPACHTGEISCFYNNIAVGGAKSEDTQQAGAQYSVAQQAEGEPGASLQAAEPRQANGLPEAALAQPEAQPSGEPPTEAPTSLQAAEPQLSGEAQSAFASADRFGILGKLEGIIAQRYAERPAGAYTTYLFDKGVDKILKKVGEESAEVIIAAKNGDNDELRSEAGDMLFHLMVLLRERGLPLDDIMKELEARHGKPTTNKMR